MAKRVITKRTVTKMSKEQAKEFLLAKVFVENYCVEADRLPSVAEEKGLEPEDSYEIEMLATELIREGKIRMEFKRLSGFGGCACHIVLYRL